MKSLFSARIFSVVCGLALCAQGIVAQTSIQLFSAVNTRQSPPTATYAAPYGFSSSTVNLTCSTLPITATLSGPLMLPDGSAPSLNSGALQPGGKLLVDNNVLVTVTPSGGAAQGPTNVCTGFLQGGTYTAPDGSMQPVPPLLQENCFTLGYAGPATANNYPPGPLNGQDPDTFLIPGGAQTVDAAGGVGPIDISSHLVSGKQNLNIVLDDEGGILTASSIFLQTNCTQNGVSGPATVSGNTINSGGSPQGQTQTFNFDTGNGQKVGFVYDVSPANNTLTGNANGSIPQTADMPLDPATFQPDFVKLTSFATSNCLIHTGELLSDGVTPACKLYTLECFTTANPNAAGANCPVSAVKNEVVKDLFDGPPFALQAIYTPYGIFQEGIGFLMASENWSAANGGPCAFDALSGLISLPCPDNLLISFSGPGAFDDDGLTTNPNSTFISVAGVPQDRTVVIVDGQKQDYWVNTTTPEVDFFSTPPNLSFGAYILSGGNFVPLPGAANFRPAPIASITYGISPANNPPLPINEPIAGDIVLTSTANCAGAPFTATSQPNFAPPEQTLQLPGQGQFLLHYYAEDCAGTQELSFTQDPGGSWSTNFHTVPINVDTTPPAVVITSPTPSQPFKKGTTVYGSFYCTDAAGGAGVTHCGSSNFATGSTFNTGPLSIKLKTSSVGTETLVIDAVDGAGNKSTASVSYKVTN